MRGFANYGEGRKENENIDKEETQTKRRLSRAKKGLITLGVVGLGCYVYGLTKGYQAGHRQGFNKGELYANDQFRALATELIKMREESKGE